jgi:hypothetical protein
MRIERGRASCVPTMLTDTDRYWRWCYSRYNGCASCIFAKLRFDIKDVEKIAGGTVIFLKDEECQK